MEDRESLNALLEAVVGAAYEVSNTLGTGFLEKVYERALVKELALRSISSRPQVPYQVNYKGHAIGEYIADLVVEDPTRKINVETQSVEEVIKK